MSEQDKIKRILELEDGYKDSCDDSCIYADEMHKKVKSWANDEADGLLRISKRQRDKFNTASIVYDKSTGKYYYGRNKGISINNTYKNPILFGDSNSKGILPEKSLNKYEVGNCAEVDAVNKALNDGATHCHC